MIKKLLCSLSILLISLGAPTVDTFAQTYNKETINRAVAAPPDGGGSTKGFKCFPIATPPYIMCAYS